MKTADLIGHALNWAVAQAEGDKVYRPCLGRPDNWDKAAYLADGSDDRWVVRVQNPTLAYFVDWTYNPSGAWWQGGEIIEREKLEFREGLSGMYASYQGGQTWFGTTHLIAAMRCYVASKLGDEVDVPEELLTKGETA